MEEFDMVTDSFAGEGVALLIAERLWSRWQSWRQKRDEKEDADKIVDKVEAVNKEQEEKLTDIRETLGGMKETQELFKRYLNKKL